MGVRKIEAKARYEFTCGVCKTTAVEDSQSRPSTWGRLILERDAFDYQGNAVADGTIQRLLCPTCLDGCAKAINDWAEQARAASTAAKE